MYQQKVHYYVCYAVYNSLKYFPVIGASSKLKTKTYA